jgi:uncharacterized protein (DUF4213/DUF364 family)
MIADETLALLKTRYPGRLDDLIITDVRIGLYLSSVMLSDGSCGVAGTLNEIRAHCDKEKRDYGDFSPSRIKGRSVLDLLETGKKTNITETLKIAVLNALSSRFIKTPEYTLLENTDPIDLIDLSPGKTITVVGAFRSYIQKISSSGNKLFVLEFHQETLAEEHRSFFVHANKYKEVLPVSEIVIITGLTLVNNTLDNLLKVIPPQAQVIVTGPSGNILPDVLFSHGVHIIGAMRIKDPELLFTLVGEAAAGYHLSHYCAEKISIVNNKRK